MYINFRNMRILKIQNMPNIANHKIKTPLYGKSFQGLKIMIFFKMDISYFTKDIL